MADIKNVVVLGDSMSDIGNKWLWPSGELGRLIQAMGLGGMRVNETGRFSDGKNWTDLLVEWATGETLMWGNRDLTIRRSNDFRTLSSFSVLDVGSWDMQPQPKPPSGSNVSLDDLLEYINEARRQTATVPSSPQIRYVNYAMGGAIVTKDWTPKAGALTYLREQVEDYIAQRSQASRPFEDATMHIIWIGLNDFVTALRPDYDPSKFKAPLPARGDYAAWHAWSQTPGNLTNGVGVFPAVAEIQSLVELINSTFPPGAKTDSHFMVIDLPSVYNAIRYMQGLAVPAKIAEAQLIDPITQHYNLMLASLVQHWPAGSNAPAPDHVHLVQMSAWMDYLSNNLATWKLSRQAQVPGVKPFYNPGVPPQPATDPVSPDMRRAITTSDLGHPTEAVYALMARYFVTNLLANGHTLGRLNNDAWLKNAPFSNLPFGPQG
jgi:hypothetical protein